MRLEGRECLMPRRQGEAGSAEPLAAPQSCVVLLTRAVKSKETRALMGRVLRQTAGLRKQILPGEIQAVAAECLAEGCPLRGPTMEALKAVPAQRSAAEPGLVSVVDVEMLPDAEKPAGDAPAEDKLDEKPNAALPTALPEAEAYVCLVAVMKLCDLGRYQEALLVVDAAVARLAELNRRSMDVLAARLYFYYSWVHERLGQLRSVRTKLLELHRCVFRARRRHVLWQGDRPCSNRTTPLLYAGRRRCGTTRSGRRRS